MGTQTLAPRAKKPKPIDQMMRMLAAAAKKWEMPSVHHFKGNPFQVLVSCLLSLRTLEVVTLAASRRLFVEADTPQRLRVLTVAQIEAQIRPSMYYRTKAVWLQKISRLLVDEHSVPQEIDALLELPGVGRKTANLVRTIGWNKPGICVDIHVHRIVNRWGYIHTKTPDQTEMALREILPRKYWMPINGWLVAFGKNICRPVSPFCSQCALRLNCDQVGVTSKR